MQWPKNGVLWLARRQPGGSRVCPGRSLVSSRAGLSDTIAPLQEVFTALMLRRHCVQVSRRAATGAAGSPANAAGATQLAPAADAMRTVMWRSVHMRA